MLLYNNVAGLRQIKGIPGDAVADRHQPDQRTHLPFRGPLEFQSNKRSEFNGLKYYLRAPAKARHAHEPPVPSDLCLDRLPLSCPCAAGLCGGAIATRSRLALASLAVLPKSIRLARPTDRQGAPLRQMDGRAPPRQP